MNQWPTPFRHPFFECQSKMVFLWRGPGENFELN